MQKETVSLFFFLIPKSVCVGPVDRTRACNGGAFVSMWDSCRGRLLLEDVPSSRLLLLQSLQSQLSPALGPWASAHMSGHSAVFGIGDSGPAER